MSFMFFRPVSFSVFVIVIPISFLPSSYPSFVFVFFNFGGGRGCK